jgi:acetylornithine deacetylase/succinyl-diaminopimelate desuccinylase-like protein
MTVRGLLAITAAAASLCAGVALLSARPASPEPSQSIPWERYQDESVELLQQYLRLDTSNPPGTDLITAEFFHKLFERAGIRNTTYQYAPGRADFYALLKGNGSARPLLLLNHMDVVRAERQNWKAPPFSGEVINGEIYGRGALDMKDAGLLQAMVMLIATREKLPLKRDLIFLATADEEVDDSGSAWMLTNHPELVRSAEYILTEGGSNLVYPGGTTVFGIGVAEKAPFWIRLTATGRGGHGSIPIPQSAPNQLVRSISRVVNWNPPIRLLPMVEEYFHQLAPLQPDSRAAEFRDIRNSLKDPAFVRWVTNSEDFNYLVRDTVSLTVLKGSPQTNVIPDTASCQLDVRLLPGEDPQHFLSELRRVVDDSRIHIEPISRFRAPNSSSAGTPLYRIIEQVVQRYNPQALIAPTLNSGYTECQMYRLLGSTCYGFIPVAVTPELESTEHAANERVPVEQVRRGVKMLYEIIAEANR